MPSSPQSQESPRSGSDEYTSAINPFVQGSDLRSVFTQLNAETSQELERQSHHAVRSIPFGVAVMLLIVLDVSLMGIELSSVTDSNSPRPVGFLAMNVLVVIGFSVEFIMQWDHVGWDYFFDVWRCVDYLFLYISIADLVFVFCGAPIIWFRLFGVLRAVRLMKISKQVKGLQTFNGLYMVVQLSINSLATFFWVCMLLIIITYVFAVMLATFVGQDAIVKEFWSDSHYYVGTVGRCALTVIEVITLDDWATTLARPLSELNIFGQTVLILSVFIGNFGLLNLLLGAMVEGALVLAKESKQAGERMVIPVEHELLQSIKKDLERHVSLHTNSRSNEFLTKPASNEFLTKPAFKKCMNDQQTIRKMKLLGIYVDEAQELFELLNFKVDGGITPSEYVSGLVRIKGEAMGADVVTMICFAQLQSQTAEIAIMRLRVLSEKLDNMMARLSDVGKGCTSELKERKFNENRWKETVQLTRDRINVLNSLHAVNYFPEMK